MGIDLTPEFVSVGQDLNQSLGLAEQINLSVGGALDMPFVDAQFDRRLLGFHIVMGGIAKAEVQNMFANVQNGTVSPVQIIAKRE